MMREDLSLFCFVYFAGAATCNLLMTYLAQIQNSLKKLFSDIILDVVFSDMQFV
jgi:hypothetical protein